MQGVDFPGNIGPSKPQMFKFLRSRGSQILGAQNIAKIQPIPLGCLVIAHKIQKLVLTYELFLNVGKISYKNTAPVPRRKRRKQGRIYGDLECLFCGVGRIICC